MPKKVSKFSQKEQPIQWTRAFIVGSMSAAMMMAFVDIFYLMGLTPFSFEYFIGSLLRGEAYGVHNWTIGFVANLFLGGIFGIFYAYCFEYVFKRSGSRLGILLGLGHAIVAAVAFFPFFNAIHEQLNTGVYPTFGILGSGLGASTPIFLVVGHMLFGASMGLFYGPVRIARARTKFFEPQNNVIDLSDEFVKTEEEDPRDRNSVYGG